MKAKPLVLVYFDKGVAARTLKQLMTSLRAKLLPEYSIKLVNAQDLITTYWQENTKLLLIPGGRDVHYHACLRGVGNQKILNYVSSGGTYFGICAGAYYGASFVEFEKGGKLEVCERRELAFFPGKAVGPAYGLGLFSYESEKGARFAQVSWLRQLSKVYFNGGCFFENAKAFPSIEILALYDDLPNTPAAVIKCPVGKGNAFLSGVHPESKLDSILEPAREAFWDYLLEQSLNPCK